MSFGPLSKQRGSQEPGAGAAHGQPGVAARLHRSAGVGPAQGGPGPLGLWANSAATQGMFFLLLLDLLWYRLGCCFYFPSS